MDPAQNNRQGAAPGSGSPDGRSPASKDPSVPSNVRSFPAATVVVPDQEIEAPMPVWMARSMMLVFVAFCVEVGLVLMAVPWLPHLWQESSLVSAYPAFRAFLANNFVRGAVSGLGVLDIWLGIYEAVHYRDPKPLPPAR
jgi:hypothetical protein